MIEHTAPLPIAAASAAVALPDALDLKQIDLERISAELEREGPAPLEVRCGMRWYARARAIMVDLGRGLTWPVDARLSLYPAWIWRAVVIVDDGMPPDRAVLTRRGVAVVDLGA